ncbi:hypothetical protein D1BOALGB6SA_8930 [Olavius sp. associated proteobacterium Delta 1]|nr:hypothetical protein D1BOALGB6SA_8930 [Olavius sp. associated proteobacterium Delta 1]
MKVQGAVIKEQGVTFAIVVVKSHVVRNASQANKAIQDYGTLFPRMPIVLMAQNYRGTPTYYGRRDIVRFLSKLPMHAISWKQYTFS